MVYDRGDGYIIHKSGFSEPPEHVPFPSNSQHIRSKARSLYVALRYHVGGSRVCMRQLNWNGGIFIQSPLSRGAAINIHPFAARDALVMHWIGIHGCAEEMH